VGANGSGKTTFAKHFAGSEDIKFINADEIAKKYDANDIQKYKIKAGKEFFEELNISLQDNKSFIIETTLSGKYLIDIIKQAKELNFKVVLIYLFLETTEDIKRRFKRSRKLFIEVYKSLVDEYLIYFNGDDNYELIANQNTILDEELYKGFLDGANNE